jgi:ParB family chromosome partitioning protein
MKRSLSSLIGNDEVHDYKVENIKIENISISESQPRTFFDENKHIELAESIRKSGVLQPIIVQHLSENNYQLIAGERRLRACKHIGLQEIPALVKEVTKQDAAVIGLVENTQRSQLNTIEEALGYKSLQEKYSLNAKEISQLVGKSRPYVSNLLRISNLSLKVQTALKNNLVTFGQVRPLIILDHNLQDTLLDEIINLKMTSRTVEDRVNQLQGKSDLDEVSLNIQKQLENQLGSKVHVKKNLDGYKISLNFKDLDNVNEFLKKLS